MLPHTGGGGSSAVTPLYTVSPVEGIKKLAGANVAVNYNDGARPAEAATLAQSVDIAIVMVGNKDREGSDRPNLSLPNNQDDLVSAVAAANPRTIVVLKTGGPVLMPWLSRVPAVLEAWYPGEEDGNAVADLLFGVSNPSGRLTVTFPKAEVDAPAHTPEQYPGVNGTAKYTEGMRVGYRWYDSKRLEPLFPFGFGLSYTSFAFSHLQVSKPNKEGHVTVSLEVVNTGSVAGSEVVQVYVAAPAAAGEPPHQLKGFDKIRLEPQETRHLSVNLDARAFSSWDIGEKPGGSVPGRHQILVGDSSRDIPLQDAVTIRLH